MSNRQCSPGTMREALVFTFALAVFATTSGVLIAVDFLTSLDRGSDTQLGIEGAAAGSAGVVAGMVFYLLTRSLGPRCSSFVNGLVVLAALGALGFSIYETVEAIEHAAAANITDLNSTDLNTTALISSEPSNYTPGLFLNLGVNSTNSTGNMTGFAPISPAERAVDITSAIGGGILGLAVAYVIHLTMSLSRDSINDESQRLIEVAQNDYGPSLSPLPPSCC